MYIFTVLTFLNKAPSGVTADEFKNKSSVSKRNLKKISVHK